MRNEKKCLIQKEKLKKIGRPICSICVSILMLNKKVIQQKILKITKCEKPITKYWELLLYWISYINLTKRGQGFNPLLSGLNSWKQIEENYNKKKPRNITETKTQKFGLERL
jgi:hypothetical protein